MSEEPVSFLYKLSKCLFIVGLILAALTWGLLFARMFSADIANAVNISVVTGVGVVATALPVVGAYLFLLFDNSCEDHK